MPDLGVGPSELGSGENGLSCCASLDGVIASILTADADDRRFDSFYNFGEADGCRRAYRVHLGCSGLGANP
jgi:hypothetical protein